MLGWCIEVQRCDFMHAFLLGIALCTNADILWELLELGHFGDDRLSRETLMLSATGSLRAWLVRNGFSISHGKFTLNSIGNPQREKYPTFGVKAHDSRMIVSWLCEEAQRSPDINQPRGKMRAALAWSQFELCRAIEEGPRYLHGGPLMRLLSAWDAFSKLYTSFALEARAAETRRWHLLPKIHQLLHLVEDAQGDHLNPGLFSGWNDETFMCVARNMPQGSDRRTTMLDTLVSWLGAIRVKWQSRWPCV